MLKLSNKGSNLGLAPCFFVDGQVVDIHRENCPRTCDICPFYPRQHRLTFVMSKIDKRISN